jgi:hypothetical protein
MMNDRFAHLAARHALGDRPIPVVVRELARDDEPELVWRNGEGHHQELFDADGTEPDELRIRGYRALGELEP